LKEVVLPHSMEEGRGEKKKLGRQTKRGKKKEKG